MVFCYNPPIMVEIEPCVVAERGQQLLGVLKEFDSAHPEALHGLDFIQQREYIDLFLVYVGLKPLTIPLGSQQMYNMDLLLSLIDSLGEEADSRFRVDEYNNMPVVWNPTVVEKTVDAHGEFIHGDVVKTNANARFGLARYMHRLSQSDDYNSEVAYGLLFGIPEPAADRFVGLAEAIKYYKGVIWRDSTLGTEPSIGELIYDIEDSLDKPDYAKFNGNSPRAIFIEHCHQLIEAGDMDEDVFTEFLAMRYANVPGTPYATFGDLTVLDEGHEQMLWKMAGVEDQVQKMFGN